MENRAYTVSSPKNSAITIKVIPGHFATSNSHLNRYLDVSSLKSNAMMAKEVARELALPYLTSEIVDTIVCVEGTEVVGAFIADELLLEGPAVMNSGRDIHIVKPMNNASGQLIFHSSTQDMIYNKNIILLVASVAGGRTVRGALDCLVYYGGNLIGISSLFSNMSETGGRKIYSVFTSDDIPGYQNYELSECALCKSGRKLDAIVNSEGYTQI